MHIFLIQLNNVAYMALILPYKNISPKVDTTCFIAKNASIIGDVEIGAGSSIWFGVVVRGDTAYIRIGQRTNIQDNAVVHVTRGGFNTIIGSDVTIGHSAIIHACTLESACFIGMGAVIMDRAVVKTGAMVAAGAVVTSGKIIQAGEIWAGNPARFLREMTQLESDSIMQSSKNYQEYMSGYC